MSEAKPLPSFAHSGTPTDEQTPQADWRVWLAVAALALSLVLLILLAGRQTLAADAGSRSLIERACAILGCEVPVWHDLKAFQMEGHDIRPHPQLPGVLRIRGGFSNQARWAQDWPELVLTLSDASGQPLAQRAFQPEEYLGAAPDELLGAGQTASLQFDVHEPAGTAVTFQFAFHSPQSAHSSRSRE